MDSPSFAWTIAQRTFDPTDLPYVFGGRIEGHFSKVMLLVIALGAIAYWLMQRGVVKSKPMALVGGGLFVLAAIISFTAIPTDLESIVRMCFCLLAVGGGFGFLIAREPVHAALGFATAVLSTCGVMFMQYAYFVSAATMIVYAGATIIIFLFVLMFAQQTKLRVYDVELTRPAVAAIIATSLLVAIAWSVAGPDEILPIRLDLTRENSLAAVASSPDHLPPVPRAGMSDKEVAEFIPSKTSGLGRAMYTDYLLAVELAGTVLLVATIGAIALAQRPDGGAS
jgi:NADH-quinone oxidoreductase subunit J